MYRRFFFNENPVFYHLCGRNGGIRRLVTNCMPSCPKLMRSITQDAQIKKIIQSIQFNSIQFGTNLLSNKVQNTTSWVWLRDSDNHGQDQYEYTHIYICIHSHIHVELLSYIEWNAGWHTFQATRERKWQCYWSISLIFSSVCHSKWVSLEMDYADKQNNIDTVKICPLH